MLLSMSSRDGDVVFITLGRNEKSLGLGRKSGTILGAVAGISLALVAIGLSANSENSNPQQYKGAVPGLTMVRAVNLHIVGLHVSQITASSQYASPLKGEHGSF